MVHVGMLYGTLYYRTVQEIGCIIPHVKVIGMFFLSTVITHSLTHSRSPIILLCIVYMCVRVFSLLMGAFPFSRGVSGIILCSL